MKTTNVHFIYSYVINSNISVIYDGLVIWRVNNGPDAAEKLTILTLDIIMAFFWLHCILPLHVSGERNFTMPIVTM